MPNRHEESTNSVFEGILSLAKLMLVAMLRLSKLEYSEVTFPPTLR
jgi:hypothetical protein